MTVEKFKQCSICRQPLTTKDIRPLSKEMVEKPPEAQPLAIQMAASWKKSKVGGASSSTSAGPQAGGASWSSSSSAGVAPRGIADESQANEVAAKHGTKLAAVVQKLQELRSEDPTAKVILFVQFDDLKRKVAGALADVGVPAVQLKGSCGQRSNIINDWQNNPNSASFVLLLSLEQSASGTNLTAASHVVFLHPMLAPSAEVALAHELQAIGRARRHGQTRSTVHVWRFVTRDTVEQSITERHQTGLFERESAREAAAATPRETGPDGITQSGSGTDQEVAPRDSPSESATPSTRVPSDVATPSAGSASSSRRRPLSASTSASAAGAAEEPAASRRRVDASRRLRLSSSDG